LGEHRPRAEDDRRRAERRRGGGEDEGAAAVDAVRRHALFLPGLQADAGRCARRGRESSTGPAAVRDRVF
jgi:hypothetical protein